MMYYRIVLSDELRWTGAIDEASVSNVWDYLPGNTLNGKNGVPLREIAPGPVLDFSVLSRVGFLVTDRMRKVIHGLCKDEIHWLPTRVEGLNLYLLHPRNAIDCIDDDNSDLQYINMVANEPRRRVKTARRLVLRKNAVERFNVFVPDRWLVCLLVSEVIKSAIEGAKLSGMRFAPVSCL